MSEEVQKYLILKEYIDLDWFAEFAARQSWKRKNTYQPTKEAPFFEEIWSTADERTAIHFVDEPRYLCRFLRVRGADIRRTLFLIRELGFYGDEELIENAAAAEDPEEARGAILRMGVGLLTPSLDALEVYEQYLRRPEPELRKMTIQAIGYHMWTEAHGLLARTATEDSDSAVRAFAALVLEHSRQPHGEQ